MPDGTDTVRVNFGKPFPLFPLNTVALMPHAVVPLHIFEPRYKQMIDNVLDGAGQIAMGVFEGNRWQLEYHGNPPVKPVVCLGQLLQHQRLPEGQYNVLLQGICRARIVREDMPNQERMYRQVMLEPFGTTAEAEEDEELSYYRDRFINMLTTAPLNELHGGSEMAQQLSEQNIPPAVTVELLGLLPFITDDHTRYQLLAGPTGLERARTLDRELMHLSDMLWRAQPQRHSDAPKGCCWN